MGFVLLVIVVIEAVLILSLLWDKKHLVTDLSKRRKDIRILQRLLKQEQEVKCD